MKVILDTDIGSDIDDAVCLAYLLAHPDCDLVGITTVSGEAQARAQMAWSLCTIAGVRGGADRPAATAPSRGVAAGIPIYPGVERPLLVAQQQPHAPQASVLTAEERSRRFPECEAVPFLRQAIRENPGEIHLLSIGPMTNVGLLFALDPEIPDLLAGLTSMAGAYSAETRNAHPTEWNVRCDPHAAAMALARAPRNTRLIGLDVTTQVTMGAEEVRRRFTGPLLERVADFAEVWFRKGSRITFHDPLAAAVLFNAALCGFERGAVRVGLGDEEGVPLGATVFEPGAAAAAAARPAAAAGPTAGHPVASATPAADRSADLRVAATVNPEAFFEEYFSVFP